MRSPFLDPLPKRTFLRACRHAVLAVILGLSLLRASQLTTVDGTNSHAMAKCAWAAAVFFVLTFGATLLRDGDTRRADPRRDPRRYRKCQQEEVVTCRQFTSPA